tara:strand:- start:1061 stop:1213 length:153 start_codon:yes stop_codon:yes gene_type:complete
MIGFYKLQSLNFSMAQEIFKPNPKQVIEDLEQIDYILTKKTGEKQNRGTK